MRICFRIHLLAGAHLIEGIPRCMLLHRQRIVGVLPVSGHPFPRRPDVLTYLPPTVRMHEYNTPNKRNLPTPF